ncbi:MAG: SDR family oxidoreductase [Chloroflexi bacterium]|nr:SDR family oxidoreductase [Chloroflexota bacterium]MDE2703244.1 SDR family oxidoreductase [Chloroflexota bacterium]MXW27743.1 SDR family oxidoreductase [Chloroflexota bacterium]MYC47270.1 SDR family oxidoreductase [Chloroflexota bacterium]
MAELDGKVAIVTGAGRLRSIGRGAAVGLARRGCAIVAVGTGRDPSTFPSDEQEIGWRDVESVADEVRALGPGALPLVADVSQRDQVERLVANTLDEFGRVDFLINNAAAPKGDDRVPLVELTEEQLRLVMEVKVLGSFFCAQAVTRALIEQGEGGSIVNVSSIASKRPQANASAYAAANAALNALTASLAWELGAHNITVNSVCPGLAATSRWDSDLGTSRWDEMVDRRVPLRRATDGDETGEFIAFLCTKAGSYINGQAINFDGGVATGY